MKQKLLQAMVVLLACLGAHAQVNSGSNGSDGALNPTTNIVINMANHPTGIYHYTSVNISNNVIVTFIPNANNTPVVWLVQSNCVVNGALSLDGNNPVGRTAGMGGPGGFKGGNAAYDAASLPEPGSGPGGGKLTAGRYLMGGNASFGAAGEQRTNSFPQYPAGDIYGNVFLVPLVGGSGGSGGAVNSEGGALANGGGGGGGGAILIAASGYIELNGSIHANGGSDDNNNRGGGGGSGGGVRFIASAIRGGGYVECRGGYSYTYYNGPIQNSAGNGRIRFDTVQNEFGGSVYGVFTQGYQPIVIPSAGQGPQLNILSVGGAPVPANPSSNPANPSVVLPAQQSNPVSIVVGCANLPLNTPITVTVKPVNGSPVSASGYNSTGTLASSTATISMTMPRGGGIIYATAAN